MVHLLLIKYNKVQRSIQFKFERENGKFQTETRNELDFFHLLEFMHKSWTYSGRLRALLWARSDQN